MLDHRTTVYLEKEVFEFAKQLSRKKYNTSLSNLINNYLKKLQLQHKNTYILEDGKLHENN